MRCTFVLREMMISLECLFDKVTHIRIPSDDLLFRFFIQQSFFFILSIFSVTLSRQVPLNNYLLVMFENRFDFIVYICNCNISISKCFESINPSLLLLITFALEELSLLIILLALSKVLERNGVNFGIVADNFLFWNVVSSLGFVFYFCF